jgi:hypothetical protein
LQRNLTENSAPVNNDPVPCFAFFTTLDSKLAMPLNREVGALANYTFFPLGDFEVFSEFLENVPKF